MAAYLLLFKYTAKGIGAIEQSPERVEQVMELARKFGGQIKSFYFLLGRYDTMMLLEAPDDQVAGKISLAIASQGFVSVETLRGFTLDEFKKVTAELR